MDTHHPPHTHDSFFLYPAKSHPRSIYIFPSRLFSLLQMVHVRAGAISGVDLPDCAQRGRGPCVFIGEGEYRHRRFDCRYGSTYCQSMLLTFCPRDLDARGIPMQAISGLLTSLGTGVYVCWHVVMGNSISRRMEEAQ